MSLTDLADAVKLSVVVELCSGLMVKRGPRLVLGSPRVWDEGLAVVVVGVEADNDEEQS